MTVQLPKHVVNIYKIEFWQLLKNFREQLVTYPTPSTSYMSICKFEDKGSMHEK